MKQLLCATGNVQKFGIGKAIFNESGIELIQATIDVDEIQGEDPKLIIEDKAKKAFAKLGKPVMVTDDSWSIHALNGFPGAYMKSVNHWFNPTDFIHLLEGKDDRKVTLHLYVTYYDGNMLRTFNSDEYGVVVSEPRGNSGPPSQKVIAMDRDNGLTVSEVYDTGKQDDASRFANPNDAWRQLATWAKSQPEK